LIEGQFPRYAEVIPKDMGIKIIVDREMFGRTLKLGGQVANDESNTINISAKGDKIVLNMVGNESGDGRIELDAEIEGGEFSADFNYLYIVELLRALEEDKVEINVKDKDNPVKIVSGDLVHIIMPVKKVNDG